MLIIVCFNDSIEGSKIILAVVVVEVLLHALILIQTLIKYDKY